MMAWDLTPMKAGVIGHAPSRNGSLQAGSGSVMEEAAIGSYGS